MKSAFHALLALCFLATLIPPVHADLASLPEVYQKVHALRAELKKGMEGQAIDYQRLRLEYLALYGPYIDEAKGVGTIKGDVNTKEKYLRYIERGGVDVVNAFADLGTHDYLAKWIEQLGDKALANKHVRVRQGLMEAIRNSATGASIEQAIPLISYRELHDYSSLNEWEWKDSAELKHDGHDITKIVVEDKQGRVKTLFFRMPLRFRDRTKETVPPAFRFVAEYWQNSKAAKAGYDVDYQRLRRDNRLIMGRHTDNAVYRMLMEKEKSKDHRNALMLAEHLIGVNFTAALLHLIANDASKAMGNPEHAELHLDVARNLVRSLTLNADGLSVDKPIHAYDLQDLSLFYSAHGLEYVSEKALTDKQGERLHPRLLEVQLKSKDSGVTKPYYFNVELYVGDYPPMFPYSEAEMPRLYVELNRENAVATTRKALERRFDKKASLGQIYEFSPNNQKGSATLRFHASGIVPMIKDPDSRPPCSGVGVASFSKVKGFWTLDNLNLRDVRDSRGKQCYTPFGLAEDRINVDVE